MFSLLSKAQMQEIKSERIASLQVVAGQDWLEDPVIRLGGGQRINISFDELTHDSHRYTYTITHCEPDWSDSEGLFTSDYIQAPYGFRNILQDIQKAGLSPVLAHPERYQYMNENDYSQLHSQGIHFQMNITSLVGGYGISAQKRAVYLLERGYYSYYGTDVHSLSSVTRLMDKKAITKSELYMLNGIED